MYYESQSLDLPVFAFKLKFLLQILEKLCLVQKRICSQLEEMVVMTWK